MTETEWLACIDPKPMMEFLTGKASDRKLRLFALACCSRLPDILAVERLRHVIDTTERFAEGLAEVEALQAARKPLLSRSPDGFLDSRDAVMWYLANENAWETAASGSVHFACYLAGGMQITERPDGTLDIKQHEPAFGNERAAQTELLREVIGPLLFRPVTLAAESLTWNDGTVRNIAQAIYDDRAFDRMSILADALEDAGCDNADILNHCRSGGEHVRGCWVVDLLLGKE